MPPAQTDVTEYGSSEDDVAASALRAAGRAARRVTARTATCAAACDAGCAVPSTTQPPDRHPLHLNSLLPGADCTRTVLASDVGP